MTPADIAASRAILAAATQGTWITVQPRSQEGAETLASFGPSFADDFPAATQIRLAGSGDFGDIAARQARMPWEQHAADCKAAAHAVNTLPAALDALEEVEKRLGDLDSEIERVRAIPRTAENDMTTTACLTGLLRARRILRGGQ